MPLCGFTAVSDSPTELGDEVVQGALLLKCVDGDAVISDSADGFQSGDSYWMEEGEKIILEFVGNLSDLWIVEGDDSGGTIFWMKLSGPTG